jgi:hypothetical protein
MRDVGERKAVAGERRLERAHAGRRTAVDERGFVAPQEVGGDDPRSPEVEQVEELEAAI